MLEFDPELEKYCIEHSSNLGEVLEELERETHLKTTMPRMLSGSLQGNFLKMIAGIMNAKYIVEVGTFTGYSAICMASGMAEGGKLISLEVDDELKHFHEKYVEKSGLGDKIEVKYGNAIETLPGLQGEIDLAFIDADKKNYSNYYEILLPKMRSGGLIIADNVLWSGKVLTDDQDKNTLALKSFNNMVQADDRVENFMLYLRDGLMMARKK
jgi:caffeoyl-CoA O-methyltransferase